MKHFNHAQMCSMQQQIYGVKGNFISYYHPQTQFAKVMFSLVSSVCPHGGGGVLVSVWEGISVQGEGVSVQGGSLSRGEGISVEGSLSTGWRGLSRGVSVRGGFCPGGSLSWSPPPRMVMSRRYASYWNAFLSER